MAAGRVVAFCVAVGLSALCAVVGAYLCHQSAMRTRRLLSCGTRASAKILEVVPRHPTAQAFPSDAGRIVVEYEFGGETRRETIVLGQTSDERYHVGERIEVFAASGLPPRVRTAEEPNIAYGTPEQIVGAVLVILAGLPLFIMLSVHALTP